LLEFVHRRNERMWARSPGDPSDTDAMIRGVADGCATPVQLELWSAEGTSPTTT